MNRRQGVRKHSLSPIFLFTSITEKTEFYD